jgi:hypothetical protein
METYNIEWLNGNIIPCYYITSIFLNRGIVRKYASSQGDLRIPSMILNNVVPKTIIKCESDKQIKYVFSNVPIYTVNAIADNGISTWELHSDDGKGHFIVRLYRDLGYIELEVIEEYNFLC